ncbi:MAG: metal-sensing transcriptional repressor [bacterium]
MNARKKESKQQLINRIHRLKGQLEAVERMIDSEEDPKEVLVQLQACISAINGVKNNYSKYLILNSSLGDIREVVDLLT